MMIISRNVVASYGFYTPIFGTLVHTQFYQLTTGIRGVYSHLPNIHRDARNPPALDVIYFNPLDLWPMQRVCSPPVNLIRAIFRAVFKAHAVCQLLSTSRSKEGRTSHYNLASSGTSRRWPSALNLFFFGRRKIVYFAHCNVCTEVTSGKAQCIDVFLYPHSPNIASSSALSESPLSVLNSHGTGVDMQCSRWYPHRIQHILSWCRFRSNIIGQTSAR
jgi:hypothetical protein